MSIDPLNQLPTDPAWIRKHDELTEAAARELGCMVILIAAQENGKMALSVEGVPAAGPLAEIAKNIPRMLSIIATAAALQDAIGQQGTKQ